MRGFPHPVIHYSEWKKEFLSVVIKAEKPRRRGGVQRCQEPDGTYRLCSGRSPPAPPPWSSPASSPPQGHCAGSCSSARTGSTRAACSSYLPHHHFISKRHRKTPAVRELTRGDIYRILLQCVYLCWDNGAEHKQLLHKHADATTSLMEKRPFEVRYLCF